MFDYKPGVHTRSFHGDVCLGTLLPHLLARLIALHYHSLNLFVQIDIESCWPCMSETILAHSLLERHGNLLLCLMCPDM